MSLQRAFTLVELSIVLVILGLLVGGILTGQSLIRASELRAVTAEYQRYIAATQTFRDKYFTLPGDMTNATAYWGSAGGNGSNSACQSASHTGTLTCNGDGDGKLVIMNGNGMTEATHYWQHLANAGLIAGSYNGAVTMQPGVSVPISRAGPNNYFLLNNSTNTAGSSGNYAGNYNNYFDYTDTTDDGSTPGAMPLKPEEAYNIDKKMDDWLPGSGRIYAGKNFGGTANCSTGDRVAPPGDAGATYQLSNSSKDCSLSSL